MGHTISEEKMPDVNRPMQMTCTVVLLFLSLPWTRVFLRQGTDYMLTTGTQQEMAGRLTLDRVFIARADTRLIPKMLH